jgi:catechol 2,3-dioxygenase-like lactoylglutathione lyase family enzyme
MSELVLAFHHVNVTVKPDDEAAAKHFYGNVLGLREVPKPESTRGRGGAWYQLGPVQLHLSREKGVNNEGASRHFCLTVADLKRTELHLRNSGVEILPDARPIAGNPRFYVRDPGGNLIEISAIATLIDD